MLDVGSGAGILEQMNFKGLAGYVCGIDLDSRVLDNPYLDEAKIGSAENIPYEDRSFDMVICNNVLEHLGNPADVLKEVNRVLKKGGLFLAKTSNKFHYVSIFSRLTPQWFHEFFNNLRGRRKEDTFSAFYRINSRRDITRYAEETGFAIEDIRLLEGRPEYMRIHWLPYLFGILYERIVNSVGILSNFRVVLIASIRKNTAVDRNK